jgi:transcriptional regulator with XRE-family HTH domain
MKTHPTTNTDWLLRMAAAENNTELSVGGLARELGMFEQQPESVESATIPRKGAFSRLIGLRRREQRLTVEQLAERADVELVELLDIEHGTLPAPPDVRTVYKLATTLKLPEQPLMQLAGLAQPKDDTFGEAAVRFAARSEPVDKLSREEHQALEEFVKFLAKK